MGTDLMFFFYSGSVVDAVHGMRIRFEVVHELRSNLRWAQSIVVTHGVLYVR